MTNNLVKVVAGVVSAMTVFTVAGAAQAGAQPRFEPDHHVTCFIMAIGPAKDGAASNAPISFGYKVSCTPRPDKRQIEYTLWRRDLKSGNKAPQAFGRTFDTDAEKEEIFFSECSPNGPLWEFYTQVSVLAEHGNIDSDTVDSDPALLTC